MKLLIFGDIYGRIGRGAVKNELAGLLEKYNPDFVLANVENMTSGRGPGLKHIKEMDDLGIDVMLGGDHCFDNLDKIKDYLNEKDSKLIRPANFSETEFYDIAGKGYKIVQKNGKKLLVIHLIGQVFMKFNVDNPLIRAKQIIEELGADNFDGIVIDFHKEASSEGYGLGFFLDGQASMIYGTHTHVQTNDELILEGGTGHITDVGMNGALYSVIGADYNSVRKRFLTGIGKGRIDQCLDKNYVVSAIVVDIDEKTRKCLNIEKIRIRGKL